MAEDMASDCLAMTWPSVVEDMLSAIMPKMASVVGLSVLAIKTLFRLTKASLPSVSLSRLAERYCEGSASSLT